MPPGLEQQLLRLVHHAIGSRDTVVSGVLRALQPGAGPEAVAGTQSGQESNLPRPFIDLWIQQVRPWCSPAASPLASRPRKPHHRSA